MKFCPAHKDFFLTTSADGTAKLWKMTAVDGAKEMFQFRSNELSPIIRSVAWSPIVASVFALTREDGRLEIWDIAKSKREPIFVELNKSEKKSELLFGSSGNSVLSVGDDNGLVEVFDVGSGTESELSSQFFYNLLD